MKFSKIFISASACEGPEPALFTGTERYGAPGHEETNVSETRRCIAVDSSGIRGRFSLASVPETGRALFRFRGMWDAYRDVPATLENATRFLRTVGQFDVRINGAPVYQGAVTYWNYRRWRFWPSLDLPLPLSVLRPGENRFEIFNRTPPFEALCRPSNVPDVFSTNTLYRISDVQILFLDEAPSAPVDPLPDGVFLGHLIGGHDVVALEKDDLSQVLSLFRSERQGNLIVLLMNPGKTSRDLDLDLVDTDALIRAGLFVALRYYGDNKNATIEEGDYIRKLQSFAHRLGDHFIGFGPHEQHGRMDRILQESQAGDDVSRTPQAYVEAFRARVNAIRVIRADVPIWDTDPSFYSRYHLMAGATMPAIECGVHHVSLDIASARGTARAFGCRGWAAINSFECQAYGGLTLKDLDAQADPGFEAKRENLWWLMQHQLYLGGARTIYSESGLFDHRVTLQKEFDDTHLIRLRKAHADLADFCRTHRLSGQPLASIAYLQGRYDIYKGDRFNAAAIRATGNSILSWSLLKSCYPDVPFLQSPDGSGAAPSGLADKRYMISSTPFGEADILPAEAPASVWQTYACLILSGWNTLEPDMLETLWTYVSGGGTMVLLLPQLTSGRAVATPVRDILPDVLLRLGGIRLRAGAAPVLAADWRVPRESGWPGLASVYGDSRPGRELRVMPVDVRDSRATVLLEEAAGGHPVLIQHPIGKGRVFLFTLSEFPGSSDAYRPLRRILDQILSGLDLPVTVREGRHVNFYRYPSAGNSAGDQIYLVNNDWAGERNVTDVRLNVHGRDVKLRLRRNTVSTLTLPAGAPYPS